MDARTFWDLIATLGGWPLADEITPFARLEEKLRTVRDCEEFEDLLTKCLFDLDRSDLANAGRRLSDDSFLYYRAAVVVAGEDAYRSVLHGRPEDFRRFTDGTVPSCERLLYVAQHAFERITGESWQYVGELDYETGSNRAQW